MIVHIIKTSKPGSSRYQAFYLPTDEQEADVKRSRGMTLNPILGDSMEDVSERAKVILMACGIGAEKVSIQNDVIID